VNSEQPAVGAVGEAAFEARRAQRQRATARALGTGGCNCGDVLKE